MSDVFFISDTHFGHKKIIEYSRPGFETVEAHNEKLVTNWNSVVNKRDVVWHLGDVAFGKDNLKYLADCNGIKKLVMGNHDTYSAVEYLKYFSKIFGAAEYKGFILTHIPVDPAQFIRYRGNIHGHIHDHSRFIFGKYVNVNCEAINLTPILFLSLIEQWDEKNV